MKTQCELSYHVVQDAANKQVIILFSESVNWIVFSHDDIKKIRDSLNVMLEKIGEK